MIEIRFEVDTLLSPQQVRAAATDFSERRPQIWSGIDPKRFTVHALGDTTAEVTEGGREFGGIWARERYDWSDPDSVVARVLDSNIFGPGSRWELRVRPTAAGGSRVEWTSLRQPSSLKGRLVVLVLRVAGRQHLRGYLLKTLPSSSRSTLQSGGSRGGPDQPRRRRAARPRQRRPGGAAQRDAGEYRGRVHIAPVAPGSLQVHWPEGQVLIDRRRRSPQAGIPDFNAFCTLEKAGATEPAQVPSG